MLLHLDSFRALQFKWQLGALKLPFCPSEWMYWEEGLVLATHAAAFHLLQSIAV